MDAQTFQPAKQEQLSNGEVTKGVFVLDIVLFNVDKMRFYVPSNMTLVMDALLNLSVDQGNKMSTESSAQMVLLHMVVLSYVSKEKLKTGSPIIKFYVMSMKMLQDASQKPNATKNRKTTMMNSVMLLPFALFNAKKMK